jgi:excinuclease ABC subunit B
VQEAYNIEHNIIPKTITKAKIETLEETFGIIPEEIVKPLYSEKETYVDLEEKISNCKKEMKQAAKELRFEDAAHFRDLLNYYKNMELLK